MPFVYSTLTCDNEYVRYAKGGADLPVPEASVLIKGGVNVADKRFDTPLGVVTEVTPEQLAILNESPVFKIHEKNGFVLVSNEKAHAETVAADMVGRSPDAPVVPQDYDEKAPEGTPRPTDAPRANSRRA